MRDRGELEPTLLRERGFVTAAGLLVLITVAGIAVALNHAFEGGNAPRGTHASRIARSGSARAATPAPLSGDGGRCVPLPAGSQQLPTQAPVGARWALVGDMAEPSAPTTMGPERLVGGFGECYAHSPLGALFAAENVIAAFSARPQSVVIAQLGLPGRARDLAVEQARNGDDRELQQIAGGPSRLIAFAFGGYAPQQADVTIAIEGPTGAEVAVPLVLRWIGADWRFVVPAGGGDLAATTVIGLGGFVPWSAG